MTRLVVHNNQHPETLLKPQLMAKACTTPIHPYTPNVGRAIDYVVTAPWPLLGSPRSGRLLYQRLTH